MGMAPRRVLMEARLPAGKHLEERPKAAVVDMVSLLVSPARTAGLQQLMELERMN
jgi:hypothetical protein